MTLYNDTIKNENIINNCNNGLNKYIIIFLTVVTDIIYYRVWAMFCYDED